MEPNSPQLEIERPSNSYSELASINVIRTETVLSRLPIHNLAKTGKVDINVTRKNERGVIEVQWEVSYNSKYGQPRQLAYKVDTVVVNRRIDEQRRPLPKVLKLGSLNHICADLDLNPSGKNIANLKRAILQNAGAMITAKLSYRATDGAQKRLEAAFTRYSVILTGERLPNGDRADGVYLLFNDPYWEVLNSAPVRPLDYDYLKRLPPAPQRFYEILSYRIFAALKNQYPMARLSYAEYCTCSAQTRYFDHLHFKKQMYKIHRPHLESQYISKVSYERAVDSEGQPDWMMCYVPGPKAHAEYAVFQNRATLPPGAATSLELTDSQDPSEEPGLVEELIRRGVTRAQAQRLADSVVDRTRALDQIDWADHMIAQASAAQRFYNPPGFYVYVLRENIAPPAGFETRRRRMAREAARSQQARESIQRLEWELRYEQYVRDAIGRHLADETHLVEFERLTETRRKELAKQYRSLALAGNQALEEVAHGAACAELARRLPLLSFEQFCQNT